jgi:hypothetical protein
MGSARTDNAALDTSIFDKYDDESMRSYHRTSAHPLESCD